MKKVLALFVTVFMFVTIFSACGSKDSSKTTTTTEKETTTNKYEQEATGNIQFGTLSGNVFTNTWSDIQITLPNDKYIYLSNEVLKDVFDNKEVYDDEDSAVNGDDINSEINSGITNFDDCCIVLPDERSMFILGYETDCKDKSVKSYLKSEKKDIMDKTTNFIGYSDVKISEKIFLKASYTYKLDDGVVSYLDEYVRKNGDSMIVIVTMYTDDSKNDMTTLLNSITDSSSSATTTANRTSPKVQL